MSTPNTILKAVFCLQLILTTWAAQSSNLFSPAYMYINAFVLFFGAYAIVNTECSEAVFMYFFTNIGLIGTDVIFLGVYNSRQYNKIVEESTDNNVKSEYEFSLAIAIINLLLRPVVATLLYRIYQDRIGLIGFSLPGLPPASAMAHHGGYEDMSNTRSAMPAFGSQSIGGAPSASDKSFPGVDSAAQPALLPAP